MYELREQIDMDSPAQVEMAKWGRRRNIIEEKRKEKKAKIEKNGGKERKGFVEGKLN